MDTCALCKNHGVWFDPKHGPREYRPDEFLAGKPDSVIWIVGLNPKDEGPSSVLVRKQELLHYFDDKDREGSKVHPFFHDWKKVSQTLWDMLGEPKGAAHVDLVACESKTFPLGNVAEEIINRCKVHLKAQIEREKPKILICNSRAASNCIVELFAPPIQPDRPAKSYTMWEAEKELCTSYTTSLAGEEMAVVLSGFIGRIDDYAKRRLGREIESYIAKFQIGISGT